MDKPILFLDTVFLREIFGIGARNFNEARGINILNALASIYDLKITDVVLNIETVKNLNFGSDRAVRDWVSQHLNQQNGVEVVHTSFIDIAEQRIANGESLDNLGDQSIYEAFNGEEFAGRQKFIATDDFGFFGPEAPSPGGELYSNVLPIQSIAGDLYISGKIGTAEYLSFKAENLTKNNLPWLSDAEIFNASDYAARTGLVAEGQDIVWPDGSRSVGGLGDYFRPSILSNESGSLTVGEIAAILGVDETVLEGSLARELVNGVGTGLAAIGVALMTADVVRSFETANAQIEAGDYDGAAQTIGALGGRLSFGLLGSEAGAILGAGIGEFLVGLGLFAEGGVALGAAVLLGSLAVGILGTIAGSEFGAQLAEAEASILHGLAGALAEFMNGLGPQDPGSFMGDVSALFNQGQADPIVLDLSGNGIQLVDQKDSNAYFDLYGTGFAVHTGWVGPQTGFLVVDRNNDGQINDITELFGNSTTDGFTALRSGDSNGDGVIDANDTVFSSLKVWVDTNGNGVTDVGELHTLADLGIVSINLATSKVNQTVNGNVIGAVGSLTHANSDIGQIGEAFFWNDRSDSNFVGEYNLIRQRCSFPTCAATGLYLIYT